MPPDDAKAAWVARVLGVTATGGGSAAVAQPGVVGLVAYRKLLLEWDAAKKSAAGQIEGVQRAIASEYRELADAAKSLDQVMQRFNEGLSDSIDAAINARNGAEQSRSRRRVMKIAQRYFMQVKADPLFRLIDDNPVAPLTIRATLGDMLKKLIVTLPK